MSRATSPMEDEEVNAYEEYVKKKVEKNQKVARIYSKNIPVKKTKPKLSSAYQKISQLQKAIQSYKFNPKMNSNNNMNATWGFDGVMHDEVKDIRSIVFYGFNGILAQRYSVVDNMTPDEINARMSFVADLKVPWKINDYSAFQDVLRMFEGTPNALREIPFDDAMIVLRTGLQATKVQEDFEEPDEEEFDDNCVETCRPGDHKCGK